MKNFQSWIDSNDQGKIFTYVIDVNDNVLSANVYDEHNNHVFIVGTINKDEESVDLVKRKKIKSIYDIDGIKNYLVFMGIMKDSDKLIRGDI